jgi:hypothetical protein
MVHTKCLYAKRKYNTMMDCFVWKGYRVVIEKSVSSWFHYVNVVPEEEIIMDILSLCVCSCHAVCSSEMSVYIHWTTWRYIPEDSTLHSWNCCGVKISSPLLPCISQHSWSHNRDFFRGMYQKSSMYIDNFCFFLQWYVALWVDHIRVAAHSFSCHTVLLKSKYMTVREICFRSQFSDGWK